MGTRWKLAGYFVISRQILLHGSGGKLVGMYNVKQVGYCHPRIFSTASGSSVSFVVLWNGARTTFIGSNVTSIQLFCNLKNFGTFEATDILLVSLRG